MNPEYTITLTQQMLVLIPIIGLLLQALKKVETVQKYVAWMPFIAIGVAFAAAKLQGMEDPVTSAVIMGLVASGGYDAVKTIIK